MRLLNQFDPGSPKFRYLPSLGMRNAYPSAEKRPKSRKECFLKLSKYFSIVGWDNYYIFKKKLKEKFFLPEEDNMTLVISQHPQMVCKMSTI